MIPHAKWGLSTTSAALLIAACFMAGLADAAGSEEALGRHLRADEATTEMLDQEDITDPSVKSSWVGKFDKAKHDHVSHKTAGYWMDTSSGSDSDSTSMKRAITSKHKRSIIAPDPKKLSPAAKAKMIAKMKVMSCGLVVVSVSEWTA